MPPMTDALAHAKNDHTRETSEVATTACIATANEMTGLGTYIDAIANREDSPRFSPLTKESMDAHSTPKMATTSPADAASISSMSSACIRTTRGTFVLDLVRTFWM